MRITVIGTGYVGLVTGTCLSENGNEVTCVDIDQNKIDNLNNGIIPIYEPGLAELVKRGVRLDRLSFTSDLEDACKAAQLLFIAVGTPGKDNGEADLSAVWSVGKSVAPLIPEDCVVVVKSTVPVGTNDELYKILNEAAGHDVHCASNPEFLKEGAAIDDFMKPDRVVVGARSEFASNILHDLYRPFLRTDHPFLVMSPESAEMTKYVANSMLATKISFINEMANICEYVGADINDVRRGMGHDKRIGFQFLFPGVGYGGSCFPKDIRALNSVAKANNFTSLMLQAVDEVNARQKLVIQSKIHAHFKGDIAGKTFAIWGLAFKPKTDDIREAPALTLIDYLLAEGAKVQVHDPEAMNNIEALYGDKLTYCTNSYTAIEQADALAIMTEWNEFRHPNFDTIKSKMKQPIIFDGRNLFEPASMQAHGFIYHSIGRAIVYPS